MLSQLTFYIALAFSATITSLESTGLLSDHSMQLIEVWLGRNVIRGGTWNILGKGHIASPINHYPPNNPFNLEENEPAWLKRKFEQYDFIISKMMECCLDFMFLQETEHRSSYFQNTFAPCLLPYASRIGFHIFFSPKGTRQMITILKRDTLNYRGGWIWNECLWEIQAKMKCGEQDRIISLVNIHLRFRESLESLQLIHGAIKEYRNDLDYIFGGDANAPAHTINEMLSCGFRTCITGEDAKLIIDNGTPEYLDKSKSPAIDGFFLSKFMIASKLIAPICFVHTWNKEETNIRWYICKIDLFREKVQVQYIGDRIQGGVLVSQIADSQVRCWNLEGKILSVYQDKILEQLLYEWRENHASSSQIFVERGRI